MYYEDSLNDILFTISDHVIKPMDSFYPQDQKICATFMLGKVTRSM